MTAGRAQTDTFPGVPVSYGWCAWHRGHARGVRLIRVEEAGSGPGTAGGQFACHPCREVHGLVLFVDRPL